LGATVTALSVGEITAAAALWAWLDASMLLLADAARVSTGLCKRVAG